MLRRFRVAVVLLALLMVSLVAVPCALHAQADSAGVAVPTTAVGTFLTTYSPYLVTLIGSFLLWAASHVIPSFGNLGGTSLQDWIKRGSLVVANWGVIELLHLFGGQVPAALSSSVGDFLGSVVQALAAAAVSGTIFNMATTTPPKAVTS